MGKGSFLNHPAPQIFLACLIPNLGGWILFFVLADRVKDAENEEKVKSVLEPPDWVRKLSRVVRSLMLNEIISGRSSCLVDSVHRNGLRELESLEDWKRQSENSSADLRDQTSPQLALAFDSLWNRKHDWCNH